MKKGWNLSVKAGEGKASGANTQIQADGKVELQAGKNIVLTQNGANVDVAVADKIEVEEVKAGNSVLNKDGVKTDKVSVGDVAIDKDGINAGNKKITNLASGAVSETSKDAVNGSQLWKVKTTADKAAADADAALDKAKTNAKDIKANGEKIAANSDKITANEKAIAGNKEAIKNNAGNIKSNGERIAANEKAIAGNKTAIEKNAGAIADNAKDIKANGDKIEVNSKDIINLKKGWNLGVKAGAGKASGSNTQILADGKVELQAGKNIVLTQNGANVDVAVADKIEVEEVKADKVSVGGVAIDKDGINAGNKKITNVTPGEISEASKDAVNGSQLWDVKTTADKAAADAGNALDKIGELEKDHHRIRKETSTLILAKVDEAKKDLREQPVAFVDEEGNRVFKEGNKWLSEAGEDITAAVKPENLSHSLVSADGSVNTPSRLHNVAAGVMDTDAVNVGQLKAVDNRVSGVERAVSDVRDDMEHAGALGAALSALKPLAYDPMEKTQIMAGVGYYSSKTAFAIGLAHHDNEDTLVHGGLSMSNGSKVMVNAGVSWRIGRHKNRKDLPEVYYDGPISAVKDMTKEMETLRTENTDLKAAYEQVKNDNAALHAENQEMKQQIAMLMKHLGL